MQLFWRERNASDIDFEDNLILFPEESEWIHVPQCITGRVYVLKFKSSSQRHFFWMQEKNDENDEKIFIKMNRLLAGTFDVENGEAVDFEFLNLLIVTKR